MHEPLLYESHMHTPLCRHATGLPGEYAAEAERKNLKGIIVTCHNPIPGGYSSNVRMHPAEWDHYVELVVDAADEWRGRVDVRLGVECDYAPGLEKDVEKLLAKSGLHHVLGSVHPQVGEYRQRYFRGDAFAYQQLYFEHLALAAETGLFDTLSHPDLVKNEAPHEWVMPRIMPHIQRALDRIATAGVAMELNTSGMLKAISEMNPGPEILEEMAQRQIPVVLGADAHVPRRAGDRYRQALEILRSAGYERVSFHLERKRQEVAIGDALASLV